MNVFLRSVFCFIAVFFALSTKAQEPAPSGKIKEYFFTISGLSSLNVSFKYKRQLGEKTFFKIGLVNVSGNASDAVFFNPKSPPSSSSFNISGGIEMGLEFRKAILDKLTFYHGPNVSFNSTYQVNHADNPKLPANKRDVINQTYGLNFPYTFGLAYRLSDHFLVAAELNPGFMFSKRTSHDQAVPVNDQVQSTASFSFTSNSGIIAIVYRR